MRLNIPLTSLLISLLSLLPVLAYRTQRVQIRHLPGDTTVNFNNPAYDPKIPSQPFEFVWYVLNDDGSVLDPAVRANFWFPDEQAPGGQKRIEHTCKFDGKLDADYKDDIAFVFTSGKNFLHPCHDQHGLRIVCDSPGSACLEPYADHAPEPRS